MPTPEVEFWQRTRETLRGLLLTSDISTFPDWRIIRQTMLVSNRDSIRNKAKHILSKHGLQEVWMNALDTTSFPSIERCDEWLTDSDASTVQQAFHLSKWVDFTKLKVSSLNTIVEVGAGFGVMCRLIHKLGFVGEYYIYDLPELREIQKYYLSQFFDLKKVSINWITDIEELKPCSLLIALYSLSESPLETKETWLETILHDNYLLAYQDDFKKMDNLHFFHTFMNNLRQYDWGKIYTPSEDSHYLFGKRHTEII